MDEHTPGPWEVEYNEDEGGFTILLGSKAIAARGSWAKHCRIDYVDGMWDRYEDGPLDHGAQAQFDEAEANARLIAAAPDLLAACALAVEDSVQGWAPSGGRLWRCQVCEGEDEHINECWVASAEAAIAKARGEQQ